MRKLIFFAVFVVAFSMFTACGHKEGVLQPDSRSYIFFSGNTAGAVAVIDDNGSFDIGESSDQTGKTKEKTLYEVLPGKHEVVVRKGDAVIVHRVLIIGAGSTKEVLVP